MKPPVYAFDVADFRIWAQTLSIAMHAATVLSKRRDRDTLDHKGSCRVTYKGMSYWIKYERKYDQFTIQTLQ